jgi:lipoprotein-releasing system permease protein
VSYEYGIGWRYVYRGERSRRVAMGFGASLLVIAIGLYLLLSQGGHSPIGVFTLAGGMVLAALFGLLYFFSVFTTVSTLGVVLGVAALTVVLAVTTGFQQEFRDKVLGVNAHVIIMKNTDDFSEYRQIEEKAWAIDPDVIAVQPFILMEMVATRGSGEVSGVLIKGVDPERVTTVLDLQKHMVEGDVASLGEEPADRPGNIIIGREVAHKLKAELADELIVVAPLSNFDPDTWTSRGEAPKTRTFGVSGIFYSGFDEYDRRLMYISLRDAQELRGRGDQVMGVELKVANVERAKAIADKLDKELGGSPYVVQDWNELNHNLFTALTLQKLALLIILTLIIVVATFNMVSALTMMVIDKTREIAILKSMGANSISVARVFRVVGLTIGAIGTALGLIIGLTLCVVVKDYGYRLDPKVYLIDRLPISVEPTEVILVAAITLVISLVATWFPSNKAASLRPVEGLRYD